MRKIAFIIVALLLPLLMFGQTAEECFEKGKNYYLGQNGMTKDYGEAAKWFRKAADQGYVNAQNALGVMYYDGRGVAKDYGEAAKWYRKAAEQGNAAAQRSLGYMYQFGYGVTKNYQEAIKWYTKAAEQGNATAQADLGYMYGGGYGVQKNYDEAIKWYRKAAEQGNKDAQDNLEYMYKKGYGSPKDNTATTQPKQPTPQPKANIDGVDTDIPIITHVNGNTFAIIIANEDYQQETKVDYAKNDGEVFRDYCKKTLGLPEKNVHFVANATLNNLIGELDWVQQVCEAFNGDASVIFYYAGHGIPDEASGSAYLLPTDGNSRLLRTCFSINELYETLSKLPAKKVTVLMDACFSGAKRNGGMLASARGVAIKAKTSAPKGSMIVLSAAQGDETAYKYDEARHGLFTYFLLKKLKDSKGNVSMGELSDYIQNQVKRYSIVENGKSQTPTVQTSDNLRDTWENCTFY